MLDYLKSSTVREVKTEQIYLTHQPNFDSISDGKLLSITPSVLPWEDWKVYHAFFEVNFHLFPPYALIPTAVFKFATHFPDEIKAFPYWEKKLLILSLFGGWGLFSSTEWNGKTLPTWPTCIVAWKNLWLTLLANVGELWKMQTDVKTGLETPKELLHESAALSYQEAQTGNNLKAAAQLTQYCVLDFCLMSASQVKH